MSSRGLQEIERLKAAGLRSLFPARTKISVGTATCGLASGAQQVYDAIREENERRGLNLEVTRTGCPEARQLLTQWLTRTDRKMPRTQGEDIPGP